MVSIHDDDDEVRVAGPEKEPMRDIGAELYREVRELDGGELERERVGVRRRLDCWVMPVVSFWFVSVSVSASGGLMGIGNREVRES